MAHSVVVRARIILLLGTRLGAAEVAERLGVRDVTKQWWTVEMATHMGRWEPTPFRVPRWPAHRPLELAPLHWASTCRRDEVQALLAADPYCTLLIERAPA